MAHRTKRVPLSVYLPPDFSAALADYAARRDQSRSLIAEAAIASFPSPDDAERREAVIAKRLDQIDRRAARLERDLTIAKRPSPYSSASGWRLRQRCRSRPLKQLAPRPASGTMGSLRPSGGGSRRDQGWGWR